MPPLVIITVNVSYPYLNKVGVTLLSKNKDGALHNTRGASIECKYMLSNLDSFSSPPAYITSISSS